MLHILSDKKRRKFYEDNCGKEARVIFENDIENGMMHGFTENYIRVAAKYSPASAAPESQAQASSASLTSLSASSLCSRRTAV